MVKKYGRKMEFGRIKVKNGVRKWWVWRWKKWEKKKA